MSGRGLGARVGRGGSFAIVAVAYVSAVGAGWVGAEGIGGDRPVLALGVGYPVSALVVYVWSTVLDNGSPGRG